MNKNTVNTMNITHKTTALTRTAAYVRVSTASDLQDGSYEMQESYFKKKIESDPAKVLVGIYGDHGISGRYMKKRPGLQALIKDCREHKIDLVLCKSVSRFARNLTECMATLRELSSLGVAVYFEGQNLNTSDPKQELILSFLAASAAEESQSKSQNIRWSRQKHLEQGEIVDRASYGYRRHKPSLNWTIHEEEAKRVRMAFYMAACSSSYQSIMAELNRMENDATEDSTGADECEQPDSGEQAGCGEQAECGAQPDSEEAGAGEEGKRVWTQPMVANMLRNLAYIGDYLSNKEVCIMTEDGPKRVKNNGHAEQTYLQGHHAPIVSPELFDIVQQLMDSRLLSSRRTRFSSADVALMEKAMAIADTEEERMARLLTENCGEEHGGEEHTTQPSAQANV